MKKAAHRMRVADRIEYEIRRKDSQLAGNRNSLAARPSSTAQSHHTVHQRPTVESDRSPTNRDVQPYVPQPVGVNTPATYNPTPVARTVPRNEHLSGRARPESTMAATSASTSRNAASKEYQGQRGPSTGMEQRSPRHADNQNPRDSAARHQSSYRPSSRRHSSSPRDRRPATSVRGLEDRDQHKGSCGHRHVEQR